MGWLCRYIKVWCCEGSCMEALRLKGLLELFAKVLVFRITMIYVF